jgi:hypothetical protein
MHSAVFSQIMDQFYTACAQSTDCALHESSATKVKDRLDAIFDNLRRTPVPVPTNGSASSYGLVDYSAARSVVFGWLYKPYQKEPISPKTLADALAALEKGDGLPMWHLKAAAPLLKCDCANVPKTPTVTREASLAIACGDGKPVDDGVAELQAHFEGMAKDSSFAENWSLRTECAYVRQSRRDACMALMSC